MKFLYLSFLIPFMTYAQIEFNQELVPYEMELAIKHLESFPDSEEEMPMSDELKIINQDMSLASKDEIYFLFKSEIYKQILDSEVIRLEAGAIRVTSTLLKTVNKKIDENKLVYSDFSEFIILSITSDLNEYVQDGFLDRSENIDRNNEKDLLRLRKLNKILGYLSPWIELFTRYSPQQFNQTVSKLSRSTIHKIAQKTFFFQNFSLKVGKREAKTLFTLPLASQAPNQDKKAISETEASDLQEASALKKEEATSSLQNIEADPSEASELIDNLPVTKEEAWKPKP